MQLSIILDASMRKLLDEVSVWNSKLTEAGDLPHCDWGLLNLPDRTKKVREGFANY